jgi:hypothetical protein
MLGTTQGFIDKGNGKHSAWKCNRATVFPQEINTGTWTSRLEESQTGNSPADLKKTALTRSSNNYKLQNRPLVREGASHEQTHKCLKIIIRSG